MINDFFFLAGGDAGLLFKIDWRLALDAMAVLPFILWWTLVFRKYCGTRTGASARRSPDHSFLQEYISGMAVGTV